MACQVRIHSAGGRAQLLLQYMLASGMTPCSRRFLVASLVCCKHHTSTHTTTADPLRWEAERND